MQNKKTYSIPALKRLPAYLRELRRLREAARERVSSPVLARALRIDTISARKDLEMVGAVGSPGVGYRVRELIDSIETFLGWKNVSEAFLIGIDGFGAGLLGYGGFSAYGLKIIAAFDREAKAGESLYDVPVFGFSGCAISPRGSRSAWRFSAFPTTRRRRSPISWSTAASWPSGTSPPTRCTCRQTSSVSGSISAAISRCFR
ncbi:MAG: redox-sensing transcriptional repressor Rex [Lentisphaeria bacterium]|nr:MAG: redox-sensing transcriptional repressor Rex [Lentisphaeria bacterium]